MYFDLCHCRLLRSNQSPDMKKSPGRESMVIGTQISGWPWSGLSSSSSSPWSFIGMVAIIIRMMTMTNDDGAHAQSSATYRHFCQLSCCHVMSSYHLVIFSPFQFYFHYVILSSSRHRNHRSKVLGVPGLQVHRKDSLAHSVNHLRVNPHFDEDDEEDDWLATRWRVLKVDDCSTDPIHNCEAARVGSIAKVEAANLERSGSAPAQLWIVFIRGVPCPTPFMDGFHDHQH